MASFFFHFHTRTIMYRIKKKATKSMKCFPLAFETKELEAKLNCFAMCMRLCSKGKGSLWTVDCGLMKLVVLKPYFAFRLTSRFLFQLGPFSLL